MSEPATGIYAAMPKVMAAIGAVPKNKRNKAQGFDFRSYDDIYLAVRGAMADNNVFLTHRILEHEWGTRETRNGSQPWLCAKFEITFHHLDGSSVAVEVFGEASDFGDKAANKAMSMAMKYALIDTFLIPTGEERDTEYAAEPSGAPAPAQQRPANSAPPQPSNADDAGMASDKQIRMLWAKMKDRAPKVGTTADFIADKLRERANVGSLQELRSHWVDPAVKFIEGFDPAAAEEEGRRST